METTVQYEGMAPDEKIVIARYLFDVFMSAACAACCGCVMCIHISLNVTEKIGQLCIEYMLVVSK